MAESSSKSLMADGSLIVSRGGGEESKNSDDDGQWLMVSKMRMERLSELNKLSIRGVLEMILSRLNKSDPRVVVPLGHGDPSMFKCFRTVAVAEDAVTEVIKSGSFNCYPPNVGLLPARKAISEYLSRDLPYKLSPDDVFLTVGCTQAIELIIHVLAYPGANILLPRPGFPMYESRATFCDLEMRHFDLLPNRNWEVDLEAVESLADANTVAMVIINPGNPCGNVLSQQHLAKIAEVARKLGIIVIADEVYGHLNFGSTPFVPMGAFGSIAPVITLGSISKRWLVPGWRLGWVVTCDPNGILEKNKVVQNIKSYMNVSCDPATFMQAAVPKIIQETSEDFFKNTNDLLKQMASMCYKGILETSCISCPHEPEGSMFVMAKLDACCLRNINDDVEFCHKFAEEESVILMPGTALGMKGWLRITFAVDIALLEDGLTRLKSFCQRHAKLR